MFVELRDAVFDIDVKDPLKVNVKPAFLQFATISKFLRSKRIIEGDHDGRKKVRHKKELAWVFHMNSPKSPYAQYAPAMREEQVTRAIFGEESGWKPDTVVREVEVLYNELTTTPIYELLKSCYVTISRASDYFNKVDFEAMTDGKSNFVMRDVFASMEKIGKLYESLKKLEEQVRNEEEGKAGDIRKQVTMTPFNQGNDVSDLIEH